MRRVPAVGLLCALAAVAVGCGTSRDVVSAPAIVRAPPQTARLGWEEPYPATKPALVFGVSSFRVTRSGWTADISVENRSRLDWKVDDPRASPSLAFGVMLFPNDDPDELERRNRSGELPAIRPATGYDPALPLVLHPGERWRGTMSAPGALAGGLWARVSFGPFFTDGPPDGVLSPVVWITDHVFRLDEMEAEPA